jgi:hypothetical protein
MRGLYHFAYYEYLTFYLAQLRDMQKGSPAPILYPKINKPKQEVNESKLEEKSKDTKDNYI